MPTAGQSFDMYFLSPRSMWRRGSIVVNDDNTFSVTDTVSNITVEGSHASDSVKGIVTLSGTVTVPAGARLTKTITSIANPVRIPIQATLPQTVLKGEAFTLDVPITTALPKGAPLPGALRIRLIASSPPSVSPATSHPQ